MGSRADFYVQSKDNMKWLGSLFKKGEPWNIDLKILIQINRVMFEELVKTFLIMRVHSERKKWPWDWPDSQMTDYSYIFDDEREKVIAYSAVDKMLFNPVKIVQGKDLNSAHIPGAPDFPKLGVEYDSIYASKESRS